MRLRRVHFAEVGHRDARLAPLTLDFGAADSVLWLRNGGGKSSILSLFYAVFLPGKNEFLGKRAEAGQRRMHQYVGGDDLAAVVTEWDRGPGQRGLLVGRALAWRGRRVSDAQQLDSLFFALDADQETGLDELPVQGLASAGVRSLEELRGWLRDLQARRPELQVQWQEHHGAWRKHLEGLGLDPELFRYQLQMNEREGAADEQFRFGSAEEFVDFLLDLAFDPERAREVSGSLGELRDQLARKPEKLLEHAFLTEVLVRLEPLCVAIEHRSEAEGRLVEVRAAATALAGALLASAGALRTNQEAVGTRIDDAASQRRTAANERDKQRRFARGLERRVAELELAEAQTALEAERERTEALGVRLKEVRAARVHHEAQRLRDQQGALEQQLAQHQVLREPALVALRAAGEQLAQGLERELGAVADRVVALEAAYGWAREQAAAVARQRAEAVGRQRELGKQRQHLVARVAARDRAREQLRADGILADREPAELATTRLEQAAADAAAAWTRAGEQEQAAVSEERTARTEAARRRSEGRDHAEAERALTAKRAEVEAQRRELAVHRRVRELTEVDEADVLAPNLAGRLREAASGQRRALVERAVDGAEDQRALRSIEETGLLPPSRDVDRVLAELRSRDVRAFSGSQYLAQTEAADARVAQLERDPARFLGVVVQAERDLELAATLRDLPLRTPVVVALPRRDDAPPLEVVVLPGAAAQWDPVAARTERDRLQAAADRHGREVAAAEAAEQALTALADRVARFAETWGDGRLRQLAERHQAERDQAAHLTNLAAELEAQAEAAAARVRAARAGGEQARDEARRAEVALTRLRSFLADHESGLDAVRTELDQVQAELDALPVALDALDRAAGKADEDREHAHEQLFAARHEREGLAREVGEVAYRGGNVEEPGSLESARTAYKALRDGFEREFGNDRLQGQLDQVRVQREEAEARLRRASQGLDPERIAAVTDPDAAERDADQALGEARTAVGRATELVGHRRTRVASFEGRRDADDLPPGDAPASIADARARQAECEARADRSTADELAAAQRIEALTAERAGLAQRAGVHADQAQRLVDVLGPVAARDGELAVDEERVRARVGEALLRLRQAQGELADAEARVVAGCDRVQAAASDERFAAHRSAVKQRLREDRDELRARADELRGSIAERVLVLDADLTQLDAHRARLVESLALVGDEAVGVLRRATRVSELPPALQAWAGQPFLKIDLRPPTTPAERDARLGGLVDRLAQRAEVPDGLELAKLAVRELAGSSLSVSILKPDSVLRPDRVPIVALSTFSRGQQLTAAIVLYCTLAQLRARSRGRAGRDADAGVLVLDNPIGTCSSVVLLQLQRLVANALRVQLVYTTGVQDLHALDVFPNKLRLRNEHRDRRTGDLHVTGGLEGVRVRTLEP